MLHFLQELKRRAESHLQDTADRVVVTVPAHFDNAQRLATMTAAYDAGFAHVAILQVHSTHSLLPQLLLQAPQALHLSYTAVGCLAACHGFWQ